MAGKRINLSDLADEPVLEEAKVPAFVDPAPRSARLEQISANPMNTRDLHINPEKITSIADSMRLHGQLQPCAVVTREAFLAIFPEHLTAIGRAEYVQVTGGRRRAAALQANLPTLDITVKDKLAGSRAQFIGATAAENIDREDYDPMEEAQAVQLLVQECGSGKAAAERLGRTPPWVTQRLNLLKLVPGLQTLLRSGEMPLRDARTLHQLSMEEQLAIVSNWEAARKNSELTAVNQGGGESGEENAPESAAPRSGKRLSPRASAIRRLGGTPDKIAESLRSELAADDFKALVALLLEEI